MAIRNLLAASVFAIAGLWSATASAQDTASALQAQANVLASSIDSGLRTRCVATANQADQAAPLQDMMQFIGAATAGSPITATYQALRQVEAGVGLCPTGRQAVALAKQLAVAAICEDPALAATLPELVCATGALASGNGQNATFATGGDDTPSGSGY